ncbi:RNA-binding S4 domain-containing protein [Sulfuriflexus sp.]|uniref:RNA-binding S4 domain-containing protein n=1 Tax=Sulfuriflexus sp. TaxID=2015443 RepID=UPI0028CCFC52|nr:S4 domain-containing protein [Sulfuriflexus sp.]MDT8404911.1 S4 domain-containing protein [Sulfuriflexus sp.]
MSNTPDSMRLDKWLWAARFFKTRPNATEAVNGGKVHYNGQRSKPSRAVQCGDELTIQRGPYQYTVIIEGLSKQRGPATFAQSLYTETAESLAAREKLAEQRQAQEVQTAAPHKRPDKRSRRHIIRFTRREK